jgi:hypothetical protein
MNSKSKEAKKSNYFFKSYWLLSVMMMIIGNLSAQSKVANLFEKIDLETPAMGPVKSYLLIGKEKEALESLLKIYQEKEDLYTRVSSKDLSYFKANYPEDINRSIEISDQVLQRYFIFREPWDMEKTSIPYQFKNKIDWKIIPFGDDEWTYMLNRHKYWIHLAHAYYYTGKEKYAKAFVDQAIDWIDNNPLKIENGKYVRTISWRTIEAGIRAENWIKSFELIKKSKYITPQFLEKFINSLYQHGEYIMNNDSGFSKTSNWGVLENHGLFNVAIFLKEFKSAPSWIQAATERLELRSKLQVLEDGTHWEHSSMYHNEVFHCLMNVNLLAKRNNIPLPKVISEKTKAMAYANVGWQKPNYHQPLLGDSDDTDLRELLTIAACFFDDSVLKSRAFQKLDCDNYIVFGSEQNNNYIQKPSINPDFLTVYQQSSGDFFMRTSWDEDAVYSSFHLKKQAGGHAHDDILSLTIFANNTDYLVDNGRFTYVDKAGRNLFKDSFSHNGLAVDNLPNSIYKGSWDSKYLAWSNAPFTKSTTLFDYAEAEMTGYQRLADPVITKRRVLYLKPNIWLLFDSFSAKEEHKYSQFFNFPNKEVQMKDNAITTTYTNKNLLIQPIKEVDSTITDSWYSPEYNSKKESKRVELFKNSKGFDSFISLIYFPESTKLTYAKTAVYTRSNALLSDKDAEAVTITVGNKTYTLLVVYNSPDITTHFFKINDTIVHGEIVLIEKEGDVENVHVIKD